MNGNDPDSCKRPNPAGFEAIFGYVLLGISILGLILTLTLPWYTFDIYMKVEDSTGGTMITIRDGSYTYTELGEPNRDGDTYGTQSKFLENGSRYVLWGFILLTFLCIIYLVGLFSSSFTASSSMMVFGIGREEKLNRGHLRSLKTISCLAMWVRGPRRLWLVEVHRLYENVELESDGGIEFPLLRFSPG